MLDHQSICYEIGYATSWYLGKKSRLVIVIPEIYYVSSKRAFL